MFHPAVSPLQSLIRLLYFLFPFQEFLFSSLYLLFLLSSPCIQLILPCPMFSPFLAKYSVTLNSLYSPLHPRCLNLSFVARSWISIFLIRNPAIPAACSSTSNTCLTCFGMCSACAIALSAVGSLYPSLFTFSLLYCCLLR